MKSLMVLIKHSMGKAFPKEKSGREGSSPHYGCEPDPHFLPNSKLPFSQALWFNNCDELTEATRINCYQMQLFGNYSLVLSCHFLLTLHFLNLISNTQKPMLKQLKVELDMQKCQKNKTENKNVMRTIK